jgi:AraC-like DNA-binding protein
MIVMSISSKQNHDLSCADTDHLSSQEHELQDPALEEFLWVCPPDQGVGYFQALDLRPGLTLDLYNYHHYEDSCELDEVVRSPERPHPLEYAFYLGDRSPDRGRYRLWGSGLAPAEVSQSTEFTSIFQMNVHLEPEIFESFVANGKEGLPENLQHLVRPYDRLYYERCGVTTPVMETILRQIVLCPYAGLIKRMYLDGKVMELLALLLEQELKALQGKAYLCVLKSEEIEQIHFAQQLLLQQLQHPPSIEALARQVGVNEYILTRGFRQVFGQTVFGYLHEYRLEWARELVVGGEMKIAEVAATVGFSSRSYFAAAFRKKFGLGPKAYQLSYKKLR